MSGRMALVLVGITLVFPVAMPQGRAEDTPVQAGPVYPNVLVEVSRDFMVAFGSRKKDKSDTINQNQDKTHTVGSQVTNTWVHPELVPSANCGRVNLVLYGITNAETNSDHGRVHLGHSTRISYISRKEIIFDEMGLHEAPAQTQPQLEFNHLNYLNADFRLPLRPLVKRLAYRAYNKQKPKLNTEILKSAGEQLSKEFNEETANEIKQFNERYLKDFRQPMIEKQVFPQRIRILTSENQLGVRALLNDPTGKPNSFSPVPDVYGWPDVAMRVEESMPNNFSHALFAGKTFTGEELDDEFNRLLAPLIGPVKTTESGDKPFTITFAKEKPVEVKFFQQKFSISLRGDEYTSGGRDFDGMYTTAIYKLKKTDVGLIAEREGDLVIYPPGFKPGDKLGAREKILQSLLDKKFSKVFKPVFEMKQLKLPEMNNSTEEVLVTTQVESDKGWLTIGWRRAPKPPEAPKPKGTPVLQPK